MDVMTWYETHWAVVVDMEKVVYNTDPMQQSKLPTIDQGGI